MPSVGSLAGTARRRPRLVNVKVLLVEDDRDVRELLTAMLEVQGARVMAAGSAAEGFELFRENRPDILVSDIRMPGEDGYSLVRRVRALAVREGGGTPAVAVTAYGPEEDRARAFHAGFQMHIAKPLDPDRLARVVKMLVSESIARNEDDH